MSATPLRHPALAGLVTGAGLALIIALLSPKLLRVLLQVPGITLPLWLELAIHLLVAVLLALFYHWLTGRLRWYGIGPGLIFGALVSLVYWPLNSTFALPLVWLLSHLAWGGALGAWLRPARPAPPR